MGGGGSSRATRAAERAEDDRRRQVTATQAQIESIYGSPEREAQIGEIVGATRSFLQQDLDRQNKQATRGAKFALARSGQTMGSVDVDTNKQLSDAYLRGALETERRAQQSGNALRQADQQSKLNLFSMAQSGLDMTTAARNAGEAMRANIGAAKADATQSGIGQVFGDFADLYKRSRERKGTAEQTKDYGFYQPSGFAPRYGMGTGVYRG